MRHLPWFVLVHLIQQFDVGRDVPAVKQQLLKIKTIKFFHVSTSVKAYKK
jgi:hypothetical protein